MRTADETDFALPGAHTKGLDRSFARWNAAATLATVVAMAIMAAVVWMTSRPHSHQRTVRSLRDLGPIVVTDRPSGVPFRPGSPEPGPDPVAASEHRPR